MPLPTAILFTLALFAAVMAALGWWMDETAPAFGAWFVAKVTDGGLWSGLLLFVVAVGYFAWRGDRAGKAPADAPRRREESGGRDG